MKKWLILVLLLVVGLRIPSLFEPNHYGDEDIYLTLGQALRKGEVFYRDIHDNKPPLLYVVAAIAGGVPGFRLILMGWSLVNTWLIYKLGRAMKLGGRASLLAATIFGVLSSIRLTEGNVANGELFMIVPATAAVLLLWQKKSTLWVGILFSVAFLFKVPIAFDMVAIGLWWLLDESKSMQMIIKKLLSRDLWFWMVGFCAPIVLSIVYYHAVGAGQIYVKAALMQNVGYVSSWGGEASKPIYQSGLLWRGIGWMSLMVLIWWQRSKLGRRFSLGAFWFGGAIFGALLSGRPYPHYMIEAIPPLALMVGVLWADFEWKKLGYLVGMVVLVVGGLFYYKFWYYPTMTYYANFISYASGKKDLGMYRAYFGEGVNRNYAIARYIKIRTTRDEKIFVLGSEPSIYSLSNRLPVGRFSVMYHIADFRGEDETLVALNLMNPGYIVTFVGQGNEFGKIWGLINANYQIVERIDDGVIWRRRI